MIAFTSDIDWAPEQVIRDTIRLFEEFEVRCTFFATHSSTEIHNCNKEFFEVAIHPNFNPLIEGKGGDADRVLDEILSIYPDAKGVRSHSMTQSTNLLAKFADRNLLYDANHFLPYYNSVQPFRLWNGMIRIPYNWEDDIHCMYGFSFEDSKIDIVDGYLNVLDFHPIHIFLNTESLERYNAAKKYYQEPHKLLEYRNTKKKGARDLLIDLLECVQANEIETKTLTEISEEFIRKEQFNENRWPFIGTGFGSQNKP